MQVRPGGVYKSSDVDKFMGVGKKRRNGKYIRCPDGHVEGLAHNSSAGVLAAVLLDTCGSTTARQKVQYSHHHTLLEQEEAYCQLEPC